LKPYIFHPAAAAEYADAAEFYIAIEAGLGGRFYDAIEELIGNVRRHPDRFRIFHGEARRHFSDVFPYAVIIWKNLIASGLWPSCICTGNRDIGKTGSVPEFSDSATWGGAGFGFE